MKKSYFITGIDTGVGKTVVSAVLTEKLQADYWKPIQSGDLESSDSIEVARLISNKKTVIHPERFRLNQPLSPHLSARLDGISIDSRDFTLPVTNNTLIIEGAGGLMVPINNNELILDLIKTLKAEVIVVSRNYLGSINHTLLTLAVLKQQTIAVKGVIFNGEKNQETEDYILNYSKLPLLGNIPELSSLTREHVQEAGIHINL